MKKLPLILISIFFAAIGCSAQKHVMGTPTQIPIVMAGWNIPESPYIGEVLRSREQDKRFEHAKIKYLLGHTRDSHFQFDRNGRIYDGPTTEKHLRMKYQKAFSKIDSAKQFIEQIASKSSASGSPYLVILDDGKAYETRDVLKFELSRLEAYLQKQN